MRTTHGTISRMLVSLVALTLASASVASAQIARGDFLLGQFETYNRPNNIRVLHRATGKLISLTKPGTFLFGAPVWITMARNNVDMIAACRSNWGQVVRVTPTGVVTTIGVVGNPSYPSGMDLDQDGSFLVSGSIPGGVYRMTPGGDVSTVTTIARGLNAVRVDPDTGDYLLGGHDTGLLSKLDRTSGAITTIAAGLGNVASVTVRPRTGDYVITTYVEPAIRVISRSGKTLSTIYCKDSEALQVDTATGNYFALKRGSWAVDVIAEIAPDGTRINTWGPYTGVAFTCLALYGSRAVTAENRVKAGGTARVGICFSDLPRAPYVAVAALAQRPGLPLQPGRTINITPDGLFWATLLDAYAGAKGFKGLLDVNGRAQATLDIPNGFPIGRRIFVAVIARSGSSWHIGNTVGISLDP